MARKDELRLKLKEASLEATNLLQQRGVTSLPVDPFELAAAEGIPVEPLPAAGAGISGVLLYGGDRFKIGYATHLPNQGFINFCVGHELGHYYLPGHPEALLATGRHESRAGFQTSDVHELQADHFAADLLLPPSLTRPIIDTTSPGIATIDQLAESCAASLTASAIHYAKQSPDAVAIIVSEGASIAYCFVSETLREQIGWSWARKGSAVPERCATHTFNGDPGNVAERRRRDGTCLLSSWFEDASDHEMSEDVVGLGSYGKTLTVLFSDEAMPESEEEEDIW